MEELNLLDLVLAPEKNIRKIERYLENLTETPEFIEEEVNRTEEYTKRTALHIAVADGNVDLVKLLLDFDAPISAIDANQKTCEDLAHIGEESAQTAEEKTAFKKILALLNTRKMWRNETDSFLLNRSIRVADKAIGNIHGCEGKTGALLMGATGHGKSTLINCLSGVDYEIFEDGVKKTNGISEPATVGETSESETLYPMLYPYQNFWIADMPGYLGTRLAENIRVAVSTQMLVKQLSDVKALVLVCTYNDIFDSRKTVFRKVAAKIGRMIMGNPDAKNNIILAVTKKAISNPGGEAKYIEETHKQLIKLKDSLKRYPSSIDLSTCCDGQEYIDNVAIKCVTEVILAAPHQTIIADATSSQMTRDRFKEVFANMTPLNPNNYNLSDFESDMRQFIDLMRKIIVFYGELTEEIKIRRAEKEHLSTQIQAQYLVLNEKKDKLTIYKAQLNRPFDATDFERRILDNHLSAEKLRELITKLEKMQLVYKSKIQETEKAQKSIDNISANLLQQKIVIGEKAGNSIQVINQKLQAEKDSSYQVIEKVSKEIIKELDITKKQLFDCEQLGIKLEADKMQAIANDAEIKENGPRVIKALESEIVMLEKDINSLELNQKSNNDALENRYYELEVNKSFFEHIVKLFNVLEKTDIPLLDDFKMDQGKSAHDNADQILMTSFKSPISQPIFSKETSTQTAVEQTDQNLLAKGTIISLQSC